MFESGVLTEEILTEEAVATTESQNPSFCRKRSFNRIAGITDRTIASVAAYIPSNNISIVWSQCVYPTSESIQIDRDNVFETILKRLSEHEGTLYLKTLSELTADAEDYLAKNSVLSDIMIDLVTKIREKIQATYRLFKCNIYFDFDKEISNWDELILAISIQEPRFERRLKMYDELSEVVESTIGDWKARKTKTSQITLIEELDEKLTIEIKRL